jgi:hypothetical protein
MSDFFLAVRTTLNPLDLADAVRREVWAIVPSEAGCASAFRLSWVWEGSHE